MLGLKGLANRQLKKRFAQKKVRRFYTMSKVELFGFVNLMLIYRHNTCKENYSSINEPTDLATKIKK